MNTISKSMNAIRFAVVFALVSCAGTAHAWNTPKMFKLDNTWPFRDKDKPQEGIPVRMVGAWTDTVMTQPGQKPQRGFGGRIMFYDKEGKKPILVDGQLVVYAFDEAGRDPTDNKPTRRYVFPADQMPIHMSKSELGASYSFWLPWDEAGGPKVEVSLICRFEPKGGAIVTGEQTHHLLPGSVLAKTPTAGSPKPPKLPDGVPSKSPRQTLEDIQAKRTADQQAQLTSFGVPIAGGPQGEVVNAAQQAGAPERRLSASTIALPQNYQLPDTAALSAAAQMAEYQRAARQTPTNAVPMQPSATSQPFSAAQTYVPQQFPQQQIPARLPATFPVMQAVAQAPLGSNPAVGQVQQQSYQQPMAQQPMVQQQMIQQPAAWPPQSTMQPMQSWPQQAPNSFGPTAVNSPATVQYR